MIDAALETSDGPTITISFKPEAEKDFVKLSMYCPYDMKTANIYLVPDEAMHLALLLMRKAGEVERMNND